MVLSLSPTQSVLGVVASAEIKKQKQYSQKINNIEVTNVVILKWPMVKESHELTSAKIFRLQNFCSIHNLLNQ